MQKWMTALYVKMIEPLKNERGAQTLEWVAVAAVVVTIAALLSSAFSGNTGVSDVVDKIFTKIKNSV